MPERALTVTCFVSRCQLVKSGGGSSYDVIPTYGADTILVRQGSSLGRNSTNPLYRPASLANRHSVEIPASNASEGPELVGKGRQESHAIKPLAVLSLFEHAYVGEKYGVWGREQYAADWFKSLDWKKLENEL
jgi:Fe-Mn family superoxide dismutase